MSGTPELLLAAALDYVRRGLAVFPVNGRTKAPLTTSGHSAATMDAEQLRRWWTRWPWAGIGLACAPSGIIGVDVDPRNGGDDRLHDLEQHHGALPDTWTSDTGGGGEHRLFARPASGTFKERQLAPGVDVKVNGYLVLPPSPHPSGRRYAWRVGYALDDLPLAPAPAWLVGNLQVRGDDQLRRDGAPLVIVAGRRNATLVRFGGLLRRYGLGEAAIRGALDAINREHAQPPLPPAEVVKIAASAARYTPARTVSEVSGEPAQRTVEVEVA